MMPLLFGKFPHTIDETQRLAEIRKGEGAGDVVLGDHLPLRHFAVQRIQGSTLESGHIPRQGTQALLARDDMIQLR